VSIRAKQSQFPATRGGTVPGGRGTGANAPNKPNFRRAQRRPHRFSPSPLRPSTRLRPVVQTNPIPPGRGGTRRTNKPNLPPLDGQAGPWLELIVPNKPNFAELAGARVGCTNKANWLEPVMPNKPNSCHHAGPETGVPRRANRAKQSQLEAGRMYAKTLIGRGLWLFRRPSRPCKTKPIRGGAGADAGRGLVQTNPI
jgi:hypothetical protein